MKLNTAGWIGIAIGGLGGLAGLIVAVISAPVEGSIFAFIFIFIFGFVFWKVLFKPMYITRKLEKNGVAASAKILEVSDTGVTVNNSPQIKMLLEITSPVSGTYMVETKQIISRLQVPAFQPGAELPVLIDPNDKNLVSLDYRKNNSYNAESQKLNSVATGPWSGISSDEAQKRLSEIDSRNKEILATGVSSRAIVTKYTWLGIYVNGNNPAVELELEVLPANKPSFSTNVFGVIHEASVSKYQPGEEIFVKYDPYNTKRITIEHS